MSETNSTGTYRRAEVVVECGMGCGWTTEIPWSDRIDGNTGQDGDDPPESADVFEGPITCPNCAAAGIAHSGLYRVQEVRSLRSVETGSDSNE